MGYACIPPSSPLSKIERLLTPFRNITAEFCCRRRTEYEISQFRVNHRPPTYCVTTTREDHGCSSVGIISVLAINDIQRRNPFICEHLNAPERFPEDTPGDWSARQGVHLSIFFASYKSRAHILHARDVHASVSRVPSGNLGLWQRPGNARGNTEVSGVDCLVPAAIRVPLLSLVHGIYSLEKYGKPRDILVIVCPRVKFSRGTLFKSTCQGHSRVRFFKLLYYSKLLGVYLNRLTEQQKRLAISSSNLGEFSHRMGPVLSSDFIVSSAYNRLPALRIELFSPKTFLCKSTRQFEIHMASGGNHAFIPCNTPVDVYSFNSTFFESALEVLLRPFVKMPLLAARKHRDKAFALAILTMLRNDWSRMLKESPSKKEKKKLNMSDMTRDFQNIVVETRNVISGLRIRNPLTERPIERTLASSVEHRASEITLLAWSVSLSKPVKIPIANENNLQPAAADTLANRATMGSMGQIGTNEKGRNFELSLCYAYKSCQQDIVLTRSALSITMKNNTYEVLFVLCHENKYKRVQDDDTNTLTEGVTYYLTAALSESNRALFNSPFSNKKKGPRIGTLTWIREPDTNVLLAFDEWRHPETLFVAILEICGRAGSVRMLSGLVPEKT
ncbi:hypothetical protein EAG_04705 [Camponotus floridanus]|uniref:Uncharacterized protein n=1 Tax=Camponotus floridanus TaxID=104421 RepID=E2ANL3_CAMFO|nr:hypothetical protein EAG_04705 [Camponotus floridanus]